MWFSVNNDLREPAQRNLNDLGLNIPLGAYQRMPATD